MRLGSRELEFSSIPIDYHEAWAKREKALDDSREKFEQVQIP